MKNKELDKHIYKCVEMGCFCNIEDISKQLEKQGYTDDFFEMKPQVDKKIKQELLAHKKEKTKIKTFKKAAVFLVAFLTAITFTQVSVQGYLDFFQDMFVEIFDTYSNVFFKAEDETVTQILYVSQDQLYEPTYIPDGYEISQSEFNSNHYIVTYSSQDTQDIVYQQNIISDAGATVTYDKGSIIENIETIFGESFYIFEESTGQRVIFFSYGGYAHYVTGFVEFEELLLIAESVALRQTDV